jgi:outer membrane cobalamin receptor
MGDALNATYGGRMRFVLFLLFISLSVSASTRLAPIVVKAKKEKLAQTWQFIESQTIDRSTTPGFEEQQLKNIPGITTTTAGNIGQLTTISIQGAASKYTKIMWNGLSLNEAEADATLIPFSTGKIEVLKGIHCAQYGNGAIGGIVNVVPFTMPLKQNGGIKISVGNYGQGTHLWWQESLNGFSIQQHIESDRFIGKNSIATRYQEKYPTNLRPQTSKQYFLNKFGFENHHAKSSLQIGLVKLDSTASDIFYPPPYDSRAKKTLQIYNLEMASKSETVQPYLKILNSKIHMQDFSPYQNNNRSSSFDNTKTRLGVSIKKDVLTFEPVIEHHDAVYKCQPVAKKSSESAFAQGIHLNKNNIVFKNWARVHRYGNSKMARAFSSSLLLNYNDTEFSFHLGTGFRLPDLSMLNSNSGLKKQTAVGGNFGISQKTKLGIFKFLLFKTEYKQQMVFKEETPININKSHQQGIELGWKNQVGAWGTEFSYLHTESVELEPRKRLPNIPKNSGNAKIFYKKDDLSTSLGLRYTGEQIQSNFESGKPNFVNSQPLKRGGFSVVYGDIQYQLNARTTWMLAIENALARSIENPHGYRNPGFQISSGISVTW